MIQIRLMGTRSTLCKQRLQLGFRNKDEAAIGCRDAGATTGALGGKVAEPDHLSLGRRDQMLCFAIILPLGEFDLAALENENTVGVMPFIKKDLPLPEG